MAMTTINGFPIYAVTQKEVPCELSYFAKQSLTWVEGSKRDQLTQEEIADLKNRYHSKNMTEKEKTSLFGELVEAGIMSKATASFIYHGVTPMDESKIDPTKPQDVLTKCDDASDGKLNFANGFSGLGTMLGVGGMGSYKNWYEYSKENTDLDVEKSKYFQEYRYFLDVLAQIGL